MNDCPKRKPVRLPDYDYSQSGSWFITICTHERAKIFWADRRGELRSPTDIQLSDIGMAAEKEIGKLNTVYAAVRVDKYCIMPDHIHMILRVETDLNGRTQFAPTISRAIKQFKGAVTKQVGRPIWQKSFYDHGIRNQQDYNEIWEYIENNPYNYLERKA